MATTRLDTPAPTRMTALCFQRHNAALPAAACGGRRLRRKARDSRRKLRPPSIPSAKEPTYEGLLCGIVGKKTEYTHGEPLLDSGGAGVLQRLGHRPTLPDTHHVESTREASKITNTTILPFNTAYTVWIRKEALHRARKRSGSRPGIEHVRDARKSWVACSVDCAALQERIDIPSQAASTLRLHLQAALAQDVGRCSFSRTGLWKDSGEQYKACARSRRDPMGGF